MPSGFPRCDSMMISTPTPGCMHVGGQTPSRRLGPRSLHHFSLVLEWTSTPPTPSCEGYGHVPGTSSLSLGRKDSLPRRSLSRTSSGAVGATQFRARWMQITQISRKSISKRCV